MALDSIHIFYQTEKRKIFPRTVLYGVLITALCIIVFGMVFPLITLAFCVAYFFISYGRLANDVERLQEKNYEWK